MSEEVKCAKSNSKVLDEICDALADVTIHGNETETLTEEKKLKFTRTKPAGLSKEEGIWWEKLKLLHCPFSWDDIHEIQCNDKDFQKSKSRMSQLEEKLEEIVENDAFQYRKFILNVVLVYEHFCSGNAGHAMATLRETEALLTTFEPEDALSTLVMDRLDAYYHIVYSCRTYLQFHSHVLSEVDRVYKKITQFDDMDIKCKAAISGVHAAVLMEYGYQGNMVAMEHIEIALFQDPDQGEWHFLLGKCLGRLRRIDTNFLIPTKKELKSLEQAVALTKSPAYIVFLAQAYRETAFRVFSEQRNSTTVSSATRAIDKMNERSLVLYKEALKLRSECSHVNVRCALGLMKLPNPYKDLHLAKKCLDKALKHAPNNAMVHHNVAKFYEYYEKNFDEAVKYYKRACDLGAFGPHMDLFRLRFKQDTHNYDPIPDLEGVLEKFQEEPYKQEAIMQMGSYHLFIKDDIENAFKYWRQVIEKDPESEKVKVHKCVFLHMLKPVNVYEVLCDESRLALQLKPYQDKTKGSLYRQIILLCMKNYPLSSSNSPIPRRKMVLAEIDKREQVRLKSKYQGRGRGGRGARGRARGRGQRSGERGFEGGRDQSVGESEAYNGGRGYRGGERGRGYRGGERGRGYRGGEQGRDNSRGERGRDSSEGGRGSGFRGSERGRGYRGGERGRDNSRGEGRRDHSEAEGENRFRGSERGRGWSGHRDSSTNNQYKHHSNDRKGTDGSGYTNKNWYHGHSSRDSSADSSSRHYSNERRGFNGNRGDNRANDAGAYQRRDSSGSNRYGEAKWLGTKNYREQGEYRRDPSAESRSSCGSTGYRNRDSSVESVGGKQHGWHGRNRGQGSGHNSRRSAESFSYRDVESNWRSGHRERNNSGSSNESSVARKLSAGRVRHDSTSSLSSCPDETKVDWKQGCVSPSQNRSKNFMSAANAHFKQQRQQLKASQGALKMWWSEQDAD